MRILITGSKGQLGNELQRALRTGSTELGVIPEAYRDNQVCAIDIDTVDITDMDAIQRVFAEFEPQIVFNCAAYTNVDACEENQDLCFKANAIGPRNIAMLCTKYHAKLLHVSTDYVFAGDANAPYSEWDMPDPLGAYGRSKYLGEQYVREFCREYFIMRTAWLYGYDGNNFVKTILRLARERGALKVVNDQIGTPSNCVDLVHHMLKVAATQHYGVYHCTGEGICSWYDFACKIVEYSGIQATVDPCTTQEFPRPAKRPAYSALDNTMLRCTVGDDNRPWQQALKYFIEQLNRQETL